MPPPAVTVRLPTPFAKSLAAAPTLPPKLTVLVPALITSAKVPSMVLVKVMALLLLVSVLAAVSVTAPLKVSVPEVVMLPRTSITSVVRKPRPARKVPVFTATRPDVNSVPTLITLKPSSARMSLAVRSKAAVSVVPPKIMESTTLKLSSTSRPVPLMLLAPPVKLISSDQIVKSLAPAASVLANVTVPR